jgi:hypothetical protein
VLVSGNFYYFTPHYYAFEPKVDMLITEMDSTSYRQPSWCRYAAGFASGKPVIVVENPYGGVPPDLLPKLKAGKGYDRFRMMQYEAAALGINMSVPYGAWMGSVIEDSFWAPHDLVREIQDFQADHEEELYSTSTYSETAVAFSVQSSYDYLEENGSSLKFPFWAACDRLVEAKQPFDVVMFPEGELRVDSITDESLDQYRTLILPECRFLTQPQAEVVRAFLDRGGHVLASGQVGVNLEDKARTGLLSHPLMVRTTDVRAEDLAGGPQVIMDGAPDLAINVQKIGDKEAAIHLIRYDYDEERDEVPILPRLQLDVRLSRPFRMAKVFSPRGEVGVRLAFRRDIREMHRLELENVPLYCVVLLQG